jgi:hypothetical protein
LNVTASSFVKIGEFLSVSLGEIVKVVLLVGVDRVVTSVLSMTKVIPFGSGQSELYEGNKTKVRCEHH